MKPVIDDTHDPGMTSWVESANRPDTDFPIQNLPFGVCRRKRDRRQPRVCAAIGDFALEIEGCEAAGLFGKAAIRAARTCASHSLNNLMALGRPHWSALRRELQALLRADAAGGANIRGAAEKHLIPLGEAEFFVPAEIGDYSDFYASIYHAKNVGSMFRPDNPLPANYRYIPIGYHGRASSIVISGTSVRRPWGQRRENPAEPVRFGPSQRLDYEMEVGLFVGPGNPLGEPVPIGDAESHIFGLCLVNDWSARDIQVWEYQPLGPFLAKSFATSISPWVVTLEALAPFRTAAFERPGGDPAPLPYLASQKDREYGGVDLTVEVLLSSQQMRQQGREAIRLSRGNFRDMYWTIAQILTQQASNGCNLRPGDLLASGTISGSAKDSRGCLLELTWRGEPIALPGGETRRFLEDGDEVVLRASCQAVGACRIGFGECRGVVQPAKE